jgi:hypothetical protein
VHQWHTHNPRYSGGREIRGLQFTDSLGKQLRKPYLKNPSQEMDSIVAQGAGPGSKHQYQKKKRYKRQ